MIPVDNIPWFYIIGALALTVGLFGLIFALFDMVDRDLYGKGD